MRCVGIGSPHEKYIYIIYSASFNISRWGSNFFLFINATYLPSNKPLFSLSTANGLFLCGRAVERKLFTTLTCDVTWVPQVEFMWTSLDQHVSIVGNTQEYSLYVCMRIQRFHYYVWTHHYHMSCFNLLYYPEFGFWPGTIYSYNHV